MSSFSPDRFKEGQQVQIPFWVSSTDMETYAALSGDRNPVHRDTTFAKNNGFRGPVVYGGLLIGAISRLLGMELPGPGCIWHSLVVQFKTPLYVGEKALVQAKVTYLNLDLRVLRLDLEIKRGDDLLAKGQAQAGWAERLET